MSGTIKDKGGDDKNSTSDDGIVFLTKKQIEDLSKNRDFKISTKEQIEYDKSHEPLSSRMDRIEKDLKELQMDKLSSLIIENDQIKEALKESNNNLSLMMDQLSSMRIENDQIKEELKESNNKLSLMTENFQLFMNEVKENNLRIEMNFKLISPTLECFRCHETYSLFNNTKCRYHDGFNRIFFFDNRWKCCDQYCYKVIPGRSRKSIKDLMKNENGEYVPDHSTGCKEHDYHESN